MARYVLGRLVQAAVTLFFVALITFALMHAVPGGPFEARSVERGVSEDFVRQQEAYYGLDRPLPQQFGAFLGRLARGDLGLSFAQSGRSVTDIMLERMKPSLLLGVMSFALVLGVGIPMGVVTAVRRNTGWDYLGLAASTTLAAVPSFVLAFFMLLVFAVWLDWFDVRMGRGFGESWGSLKNGILPAVALGAPSMAHLARLTRGAMLEVLDMDYMRTARAKGLSTHAVTLRHGLRNALIPILTLVGPIFAVLITGSIIIESIFGLPGIGSAFITSVSQRDYGMIMGTTLMYAAVIMAVNLAVDLAYPLVDPRVRLAS
ncbi:MAG: ABC transporter permease subunit [Dehalococcoidia bacterium]|nr:ABC transporter permease subunit [Dehalococcoidia bacterium]